MLGANTGNPVNKTTLHLPKIAKPKPKTLVQQNADFTAEGSPPPGKVATQVPAVSAGVVAPLKPGNGAKDSKKY